jgi:RND superfamily putative drug exporter
VAGITLIPAIFSLFGRKAFWPSIPKYGEKQNLQKGLWAKVAKMVTKRPVASGGIVLVLLATSALYMTNIHYSFNLIKSFPKNMESRVGFEMVGNSFSKGELAPTDVLLTVARKGDLSTEKVETVIRELEKQKGVNNVSVQLDRNMMMSRSANPYAEKDAVKLKLTFKDNPYELDSLNAMDKLRDNEKTILKDIGMDSASTHLYFGGETAKQADVRALNDRDTSLTVILIMILIFLLLIVQTKSIVAPIYMIATILISYTSAMGISYFIFEKVFGYDSMSYRIPLYAFVFLVALGVDYNIMLMSRIQEELKTHEIKEAIRLGVTKTGGVISSAGIILGATFSVLITQPIMELFMFGFVTAIGVLIDTFIVRGILVPSIMLLIGKWNFWPRRLNLQKDSQGIKG